MTEKEESLETQNPFCVWGVINTTPDSFFDGGRFYGQGNGNTLCPDLALSHALELVAQGAQVLDIGGASSRPGAADVPEKEEQARVLPLVQALVAQLKSPAPSLSLSVPAANAVSNLCTRAFPFAPCASPLLSVDTWRASVAKTALEAGAAIINDISGALWDSAMENILAEYKPFYVLMHSKGKPVAMQNAPSYTSVVEEVLAFFEMRMEALVCKGLPESRIILDIGIGFGKSLEHNLILLQNIEKFLALGRPLLVGLSQKSLFGDLLGLAKGQRSEATAIAVALLASRGVVHHRVHNVLSAVQALRLTHAFAPAVSPLQLAFSLRAQSAGEGAHV